MTTTLHVSALGALGFSLLLGCDPNDDRSGIMGPAIGIRTSPATSSFSPWSEPKNLGPTINTSFSEQQVALSKNGLSLYFNSNRPEDPADEALDANIWVAQRACRECPWEAPVSLGTPINTPGNDANPNLSRDGHWLYFTTNRQPSLGGNDMWVSYRENVHDDFGWQDPVNLGPAVNSSVNEAAPNFFENDKTGVPQLFFNRQSGPPNVPSGDIYVSLRSADGTWVPASPVHELNSSAADQRPSITHSGLEIYFWSDRSGAPHIWHATRASLEQPWSPPAMVGPPISDAPSRLPHIHSDGRTETLFFTRDLGTPGGANPDLFMSTRTRGEQPSTDVAVGPRRHASSQTADDPPQFSDWSAPVHLGSTVNSMAGEIELSISRDGLSMYLASSRSGNFDIWVSRRTSVDQPWGPPLDIGPIINTPAREQAPFLSIDGHRLYFFSDRVGGLGGTDLYVSRRRDTGDDFGWETPVNLGSGVNGAANETLPVYFEDDATGTIALYFTSNRTGSGDIYASTLQPNDVFGPAVPVEELNSPRRDRVLAIRRDGLELFLASDRPGPTPVPFDLWVATRASTSDPWSAPVNLGPVVNGTSDEGGAALSFDGTVLYIASDRAGGVGNLDFWVSMRSKVQGPPQE